MLERIKEVSEAALIAARHRTGSYSQLGEDVILKYIADEIGIKTGTFIDIGASDGISMSNSYLFREFGWKVLAFDGAYENEFVKKAFLTAGNVVDKILETKEIVYPNILSLDIDGQDFYILQSIIKKWAKPDIICLEFNGCIDQSVPFTVPLQDDFRHDATDYYGANLIAFKELLKDYTLVFHHQAQNAFFVHKSFNCPEFTEPVQRFQYHPHNPNAVFINPFA